MKNAKGRLPVVPTETAVRDHVKVAQTRRMRVTRKAIVISFFIIFVVVPHFQQKGALINSWISYRGSDAVVDESTMTWYEPTIDTEVFSCNRTIPDLHALHRRLGLRTAQGVLVDRSELVASRKRNATARGDGTPKVLLTDFGWMDSARPDRAAAEPRSKLSTLMQAAVQDHPWYDPTGWAEASSAEGRGDASDPASLAKKTRYVFLDVETCVELNWPVYGAGPGNLDTCNGRQTSTMSDQKRQERICDLINRVLATPIFTSDPSTDSKIVVFDCWGYGPVKGTPLGDCLGPNRKGGDRVVTLSLSAKHSQLISGVDLGLPPPAPNPAVLSQKQVDAIATCDADRNNETRPYFLSFKGTQWGRTPGRAVVVRLRRGRKDIITFGTFEDWPKRDMTYQSMLTGSKFSAAIRGDNLFSYRFTEVMSAGAIPVVYADGWVLPFSRDLIPWEEYMVVIEEHRANETLSILSQISDGKRCQMRKKAWEVYNKYMKSRSCVLQGILDSLEARRRMKKRRNRGPVWSLATHNLRPSWSVMTPYHENGTWYVI